MPELILYLEEESMPDDTVHYNMECIVFRETDSKGLKSEIKTPCTEESAPYIIGMAAVIAHYASDPNRGPARKPARLVRSVWEALKRKRKKRKIGEIFGKDNEGDQIKQYIQKLGGDGNEQVILSSDITAKVMLLKNCNFQGKPADKYQIEDFISQLYLGKQLFFSLTVWVAPKIKGDNFPLKNNLPFRAQAGDRWTAQVRSNYNAKFALFWIEWAFDKSFEKSGDDPEVEAPYLCKPLYPFRVKEKNLVPRKARQEGNSGDMTLTIPSVDAYTISNSSALDILVCLIADDRIVPEQIVAMWESLKDALNRMPPPQACRQKKVEVAYRRLSSKVTKLNLIEPDEEDVPGLERWTAMLSKNYNGDEEHIEIISFPVLPP